MKNILLKTIGLTALIALCSCKSEPVETTDNNKKLQESLVSNYIEPALADFQGNVKDLKLSATTFNQNTNLDNLQNLKVEWLETALSFSRLELFNIGDVKDAKVFNVIYKYPVQTAEIIEYIQGTEEISLETIEQKATSQRGLGAIEFLIYSPEENQALVNFQNDRYKNYLEALTGNLEIKAQNIENKWNDYKVDFIANTQNGIDGSVNKIFNSYTNMIVNIRKNKVGKPAGIISTSTIDTNILQAPYSRESLNLIRANMYSMKNFYTKNQHYNFYDYTLGFASGNTWNDALKTKFTDLETKVDNLADLQESLETENLNPIYELYDELEKTLNKFIEIAPVLDVTLTPTDNDGD